MRATVAAPTYASFAGRSQSLSIPRSSASQRARCRPPIPYRASSLRKSDGLCDQSHRSSFAPRDAVNLPLAAALEAFSSRASSGLTSAFWSPLRGPSLAILQLHCRHIASPPLAERIVRRAYATEAPKGAPPQDAPSFATPDLSDEDLRKLSPDVRQRLKEQKRVCMLTIRSASVLCDLEQYANNDQPLFYPIGTTRLVIMSIFTLGVYDFVWFYRQWVTFSKAAKVNYSPAARTALIWLYFNALAIRVDYFCSSHGIQRPKPLALTITYLVLSVLWLRPLTWIPIVLLQSRINQFNSLTAQKAPKNTKFSKPELLYLCALAALVCVQLLYGV